MKALLATAIGLFVLAVLLGIVQIWFCPWLPDTFVKIELTLGALLTLAVVGWYGLKEYAEDKERRNGQHLD